MSSILNILHYNFWRTWRNSQNPSKPPDPGKKERKFSVSDIKTGRLSGWFHTRSYCALILDGERNEKFEQFWPELTLDYMEAEIKNKEMESNHIRNETLQAARR